jgi:hypothetical protein
VADDMSPGEVRRTLERIEQAQRDSNRATDDRISELARKAVPAELWAAEQKNITERIEHGERDHAEALTRIENRSLERFTTVQNELAAIRGDLRDHEQLHKESTAWSRNRVLTAIGITVGAFATLAGAWIAAVIAAKGVH